MMLISGKRRTGTRRKVQAFEKLGLVGGLNRLQVACGEALLEPHLALYHEQGTLDCLGLLTEPDDSRGLSPGTRHRWQAFPARYP